MRQFDVNLLRMDFPVLLQKVYGKPLVYLDNAATVHKPAAVLNAIRDYYDKFNANPHRGVHFLGVKATEMYEQSRERVKEFINAGSSDEIIFTKNTTESLNLIAYSYGMEFINEGDEIVVCISEHHSNIVPWQKVAKAKKAVLKYLYLNNNFTLDMEEVHKKITDRTKLVSIAQMSNVLGTIYPVNEIIDYAHSKSAVAVIDGAQGIPHMKTDVKEMNADFYVFSGHKMMGPMGIGVLFGKRELLEKMPPFLMGGDMIEYVEEQTTTFAELPYKFEAGTPNPAGAIGLAAAIDYLESVGYENIQRQEMKLTSYTLAELSKLPYVTVYGPHDIAQRGSVISFGIEGCHPHDVASIADEYGVALRAGHHCAQPLMKYLQAPATTRASFSFYNTEEEAGIFIDSLKQVRRWFRYEP